MDNTKLQSEMWIQSVGVNGEDLSACFCPSKGMNLLHFKKGEWDVIDQSTKPLFEERYAGLGAIIGPHFHHRNPKTIPHLKNEALFPHIAKLKAQGILEPFSHGIGRYAPWEITASDAHSIQAVLSGEQLWNEMKLKEIEGQDFKMTYHAKLNPYGLEINLAVKSDTESIVGLHTYYTIGRGRGVIKTRVQDHFVEKSEVKSFPSTWNYAQDHTLTYPLDKETDFGFHPYPDPLHGRILLESQEHTLEVQYWCNNDENSFQLWHPAGKSFVCIEPLSAKDPRKPKLTASSIKILISIHKGTATGF